MLIGCRTFLVTEQPEYKSVTSDTYQPESITKNSTGYFITFKKTYVGKLNLLLDTPLKDTVIVSLGEKANGDNVDVNPPGTVRFFIDTLFLEKGKNTFQITPLDFKPPDWAKNLNNHIKLPQEIGNIMPFRYVEVISFSNLVEVSKAEQISYFYPFDDNASYCQTSSEVINKIWELCKHSVKATSYCGVYIDGDRERRPYEADAYINQLSHYAVDSEYGLARKTIDHLVEFPTWPSEWQHHMPMMLWEDYMYTGNKDYLIKYYEHYARIIQELLKDSNGLVININNQDIIDWPACERDGYQLGEVNSVPNAFYFNSLILLSKIADVLEHDEDKKYFSNLAVDVKRMFNLSFWDEQRGLYIDALGNSHSSIHANIFPTLFGLADNNQIERVMPFVFSKGMGTSVYGAQYLIDLIYINSKAEHAFNLLTSNDERGWLQMIERGSTITWEAWNEKVKPNLDWNHAWGASPANIIARRIFGIRPLESGFNTAVIEPKLYGLTHGKFVHPTINGKISMEFNKEVNEYFKIVIENEMPVHFIIPTEYRDKSLKLNERLIKQNERKYLNLCEGQHTLLFETKLKNTSLQGE